MSIQQKKIRCFIIISIIHIFYVFISAFDINFFQKNATLYKISDFLGTLSGANNTYAFFAPSVPPSLKVNYKLFDNNFFIKEVEDKDPYKISSLNLLQNNISNKNLRTAIVASYAADIFRQYPKINRIKVLIFIQVIPTLENHTNEHLEWEIFYEVTFTYARKK